MNKTRSGFEYLIADENLDDWELLEQLREIDKGNSQYVVDVAQKLLGKEQYEALKEHIKKEHSRVSVVAMTDEIEDILSGTKKLKNL